MFIDKQETRFVPTENSRLVGQSLAVSFSFTYACTSLYISHSAVSVVSWSYLQALLLQTTVEFTVFSYLSPRGTVIVRVSNK
jgi:hypothetical protein